MISNLILKKYQVVEHCLIKNENGEVTSLVSKNEIQAAEIDELVEKTFEGSLPAFIAAFVGHKRLSESEREELLRLIDGTAASSEGGEDA